MGFLFCLAKEKARQAVAGTKRGEAIELSKSFYHKNAGPTCFAGDSALCLDRASSAWAGMVGPLSAAWRENAVFQYQSRKERLALLWLRGWRQRRGLCNEAAGPVLQGSGGHD